MGIRWRLAAVFVQLLVLAGLAWLVEGRPYSGSTWFMAGLLAAVVNPLLMEPHYPRPGDIIANSIMFVALLVVTPRQLTGMGWIAGAVVFGAACLLAVVGQFFGASRQGLGARLGGVARTISQQIGSARLIYSSVFVLAVLEENPGLGENFWTLILGGAAVLFVGLINWQSAWVLLSRGGETCRVEGLMGPSVLLVTAPRLPAVGTSVELRAGGGSVKGVLIGRIGRLDDTWGQIHVTTDDCESLLRAETVTILAVEAAADRFVGPVDAGSSDQSISFLATRPLETGKAVSVVAPGSDEQILFQLASAQVERSEVRGGSHLVVRGKANQLGRFDRASRRFIRHRWVPNPGSAVELAAPEQPPPTPLPPSWVKLGTVLSTEVPIYMDSDLAREGHLAILGMTKMGKTTLATRLAKDLSKSCRVTVLDQTGEYVGKSGLAVCSPEKEDWAAPGLTVVEPKPGDIAADKAHKFLKFLLEKAQAEYGAGTPFPRVVVIDEAHQFVPETAALGFNAPGRDASFAIGALMMQIRKFGISIVLISQRTAVVSKSALSQCENLIAFRSVDQTGLDYLEAVAGSDVRSLLPRLRQAEALVFGPAMSCETPVAIAVDPGL